MIFPMRRVVSRVCLILAALAVSATVPRPAKAGSCYNQLDIVVAVDVSESRTRDDFLSLKSEVKDIFSGFTVGRKHVQLALISMSGNPTVAAQFLDVNSLVDFNAKVDSLALAANEISNLALAVKLAKDSVFDKARKGKVSKVFMLVKDRRYVEYPMPLPDELKSLAAEAAALKSTGVAIHAVGVAGLWNTQELHALYNNGYLLFKDKAKAIGSAQSLSNTICKADCPNSGTSKRITGLCYNSLQHIITTKSDLVQESKWLLCRTEIARELGTCSVDQRCNTVKRDVSPCNSGKITIVDTWQIFDFKRQACVEEKSKQIVACYDASKCPTQIADVIFLLDKSASLWGDFAFVKKATKVLISALNIAPFGVRVGVITFAKKVRIKMQLKKYLTKVDVLNAFEKLVSNGIYFESTRTELGLLAVRDSLSKYGRPEVAKYAFVITDGESDNQSLTLNAAAVLKDSGVTVYAIGVGDAVKTQNSDLISELKALAAPQVDKHMILVRDLKSFQAWATKFAKSLCVYLSDPNPKFCKNSVFIQSISDCIANKQLITKSTYKYDTAKKCIKSTNSTVQLGCRKKCTDPIMGNEYLEGDTWTALCHQFQCTGKGAQLSKSMCPDANGGCKAVGGGTFNCRDTNGTLVSNCRCESKAGKTMLVIKAK